MASRIPHTQCDSVFIKLHLAGESPTLKFGWGLSDMLNSYKGILIADNYYISTHTDSWVNTYYFWNSQRDKIYNPNIVQKIFELNKPPLQQFNCLNSHPLVIAKCLSIFPDPSVENNQQLHLAEKRIVELHWRAHVKYTFVVSARQLHRYSFMAQNTPPSNPWERYLLWTEPLPQHGGSKW